MHGIEKRIVYVLRSDVDPSRHYVGITNDLRARLGWHNDGPCGHTQSHRPWSMVVSLEFPTEKQAVRFEKYLKSSSGRAFAKRHFASLDDRYFDTCLFSVSTAEAVSERHLPTFATTSALAVTYEPRGRPTASSNPDDPIPLVG